MRRKLAYWVFFLFASNEILCKIFRKPHSMAGKFAPKNIFFIKVFSFVFLVPEKRSIFAKVQRRIKSKIRLSYRLSFKLLVVNQSNMLYPASVYKIEAKGKDLCEVQFFGKFIMCSNNEDTPVLIEPGETRYWVRKINPLKK